MSPPNTFQKPLSASATLPTILDRAKLGAARRSTPDSEALVSSDDEHEHVPGMSMRSMYAGSGPKPVRRSSWLSEVQSNQTRKVSFGSFSGNQSQPATPSGEQGPWPTSNATFRSAPNGNVPWSTQIWNAESRKELPLRFCQMPHNYAASDMSAADERDGLSAIPFQIPLEPNRKAYRSLSYSVGQLDEDHGPNSSTQGLGKMIPVREDEDDDGDESSEGSSQGRAVRSPIPKAETSQEEASKTLLKQATHSNARSRNHSSSPSKPESNGSGEGATQPLQSESAIEELDDVDDLKSSAVLSDLGYNLKRGQWHSSLGFGGLDDSQSRRHSFADVPGRNGFSRPSLMGYQSNDSLNGSTQGQMMPGVYGPRRRRASQMSSFDSVPHGSAAATPPSASAIAALPAYLANPYATSQAYSRPAPNLHVVSFKCARAEIYYIPANTGLEVKKGDMVIVDGDRGMDLGTVCHSNVTVQQAKSLKEEYSEMHFRWLMLFSRTSQNGNITNETNFGPMSASPVAAVSRSAPGHHGEVDLRPKMIKRHAQPHEIHLLKDKEGSEAKAKRVCAGKVDEHGLNMEILDAEFQYDYKKLTFFYFADAYINFNDLVSDLFKTYKTRIWMSAVNPASFATGGAPLTQPQQPAPIHQQHQQHPQTFSNTHTSTTRPPLGLSQPPSSIPTGSSMMGFPQSSLSRMPEADGNGGNSRELMLPPGLAMPLISNPLMYQGAPNHLNNNPTSSPSMNNHGYPQLYPNAGLPPSDVSMNGSVLGPRFNGNGFGSLRNIRPSIMMDDPLQQQPNQQYRPIHQNIGFQHSGQPSHRGMANRNPDRGPWDHRPVGVGVGGGGVNAELTRGMNNLGLA